jgi:hypothetical protein
MDNIIDHSLLSSFTTTYAAFAALTRFLISLHSRTASDTNHTVPQQKQLEPHPSKAKKWQHYGS